MKRFRKIYEKIQVPITEEAYRATLPLTLITRLLGLFPVSVEKIKTKIIFRWSPYYGMYSYALGFALVVYTYYGLFEDIMSKKIDSVRIRSVTKACVVFIDVTASQVIILFAVFYSSTKLSAYFKFLACLQETHSTLPINHNDENKWFLFGTILISLSALSVLLIDALIYDLSNDARMKFLLFKRYGPFYTSFIVTIFAQYQIWFNCRLIFKKISKLNEIIQINYFNTQKGNVLETWNASHFNFENLKMLNYKDVGFNVDFLKSSKKKNFDQQIAVKPFQDLLIPKAGHLKQLANSYIKLWEATKYLNQCFGPTVATVIVDILWQMIQGSFYIVVDFSQETIDYVAPLLQLLWICFASSRLLSMVQPAHLCFAEVQKTRGLIGKLIVIPTIAEKFRAELEGFSEALLHCQIEFSAAGLIKLSRSLISSLLASVTTYLVILVQYRNS